MFEPTRRSPGHDTPARVGRRLSLPLAIGVLALSLSACAVTPEPSTPRETEERVQADLARMFGDQAPINGPLSLSEAMARAILYNLDGRQRTMETALAQRQVDLSRWEMLPELAASAGFVGRNNQDASSSENVETGVESLVPSTSSETHRRVADLTLSWNILDFGLSYVTARQNADRVLVAMEQRRKIVHTIIQDVRSAYWRAVAAERVLRGIEPLTDRINRALIASEEIQRRRLTAPIDALNYQRGLLDALRQLQAQRRELRLAKTELAALINLRPGDDFTLSEPDMAQDLPDIPAPVGTLEHLALTQRPELKELDYQKRVSRAEARKEILGLLPGIDLSLGYHYDSNKFLVNSHWADYGIQLAWNLLNVVRVPAMLDMGEAREAVADARRMAMSMAILAQVHVAGTNYEEAREQFDTASKLAHIEKTILDHVRATGATARAGELSVIQTELAALQADLRRDLAFADANNAFGRLYMSIGEDPIPNFAKADMTVTDLAARIAEKERDWRSGRLTETPTPPPESAAAPEAPAADQVAHFPRPQVRQTVHGLAVVPAS
jgi:outer membrane protein TolC